MQCCSCRSTFKLISCNYIFSILILKSIMQFSASETKHGARFCSMGNVGFSSTIIGMYTWYDWLRLCDEKHQVRLLSGTTLVPSSLDVSVDQSLSVVEMEPVAELLRTDLEEELSFEADLR